MDASSGMKERERAFEAFNDILHTHTAALQAVGVLATLPNGQDLVFAQMKLRSGMRDGFEGADVQEAAGNLIEMARAERERDKRCLNWIEERLAVRGGARGAREAAGGRAANGANGANGAMPSPSGSTILVKIGPGTVPFPPSIAPSMRVALSCSAARAARSASSPNLRDIGPHRL